jgi:hypothetical protein
MGLYVKLFASTAPVFGIFMALTRGHNGSIGGFLGTAAVYGIPFGIVMAALLGTLQRRGERKELAKRTKRERSKHGQAS